MITKEWSEIMKYNALQAEISAMSVRQFKRSIKVRLTTSPSWLIRHGHLLWYRAFYVLV